MKKYYEEAKYNAAFDRCVDVMSQMLQKYGHQVLDKLEQDTRGTLCLNLYRYNESQRIDCGHVLAKNSSEHYHYIRYGIALFSDFQ